MPLINFQMNPGLVRDVTDYSSNKIGPYWIRGKNIRFRDGFPRKIGGWVKENIFGINSSYVIDREVIKSLDGKVRSLRYWRTVDESVQFLAAGTSKGLFIIHENALYNITPLKIPPITLEADVIGVVVNSTNVLVSTDVEFNVGDFVYFRDVGNIGGIPAEDFNSPYGFEIIRGVTEQAFIINLPTPGLRYDVGGAGATINFIIGKGEGLGVDEQYTTTGWSSDPWSTSYYGRSSLNPVGEGTDSGSVESSEWSLTIWGQDLIASVKGNRIYYWNTTEFLRRLALPVKELERAQDIYNPTGLPEPDYPPILPIDYVHSYKLPLNNRLTIASFPDRHLISMGTNPFGQEIARPPGAYVPGEGATDASIDSDSGEDTFTDGGGARTIKIHGLNEAGNPIDVTAELAGEDPVGVDLRGTDASNKFVSVTFMEVLTAGQIGINVGSITLYNDDQSQIDVILPNTGTNVNDGKASIDPMLVRWAGQETFKNFYPREYNTAGFLRLQIGTQIRTAIQTRQEIIILTDEACYSMAFAGGVGVDTFDFSVRGTACGALGLNSSVSVEDTVYWMGESSFFSYEGAVEEMECPIKYYVFDRINLSYSDKIHGFRNKNHDEITWIYPIKDSESTEPTEYVTYNYMTNSWSLGELDRTSWHDAFGTRDVPFAFSPDGQLYNHETGYDADSQPLEAYIESAPFEIDQSGDNLMLLDKIIPDGFIEGNLNLTLGFRKYPNALESKKGPFQINSSTRKISMRARGRQMTLRFESNEFGSQWQLGSYRYNTKPDGFR